MTWVDDAIVDVLGWTPEELVGLSSTEFIHPQEQAAAVAAWFEMISSPGGTKSWRGRYRTSDESWRWVEVTNTNYLEEADEPRVETVLRVVEGSDVTVEEELRSRKQLLNRLTEALPVGVFQLDPTQRIRFSNDRLHEVLRSDKADTVAEQFAAVIDDDRLALGAALGAVFANQDVDDVELRIQIPVPHPEFPPVRVCQLSLRPLTDKAGEVTGAIGCITDITDSVELRRQLEARATIDGLTGCLNRTASLELLDRLVSDEEPLSGGVAVAFIDLDGFKAINDRFGHAAGDRALIVAAERIRAAIRPSDILGRLGGDEFLVICPGVTGLEQAVPIARRVSAAICQPVRLGGAEVPMGASLGVAWTAPGRISPEELIARSDHAMYESKQAGRHEVVVAA